MTTCHDTNYEHPVRARSFHSIRIEKWNDLRLRRICDGGSLVLLRLRQQGRDANQSDGLADHAQQGRSLSLPIDRQLELPLPIALLDKAWEGHMGRTNVAATG